MVAGVQDALLRRRRTAADGDGRSLVSVVVLATRRRTGDHERLRARNGTSTSLRRAPRPAVPARTPIVTDADGVQSFGEIPLVDPFRNGDRLDGNRARCVGRQHRVRERGPARTRTGSSKTAPRSIPRRGNGDRSQPSPLPASRNDLGWGRDRPGRRDRERSDDRNLGSSTTTRGDGLPPRPALSTISRSPARK